MRLNNLLGGFPLIHRRQFLVGGAAVFGLAACGGRDSSASLGTVRYASPAPVWWNAPPLFASERNLYEPRSVTVRSFDVATGTRSKEAVVDGNAEVGVAAPNSFSTASSSQLSSMRILCNTMNSETTVSIVSRDDIINWETVRIGLVKGTIAEFYLISYLRSVGLLELYTSNRLTIVSLSPVGVVTAFESGEIDVASIWEPYASQIAIKADGTPNNVIRDTNLYRQQIYLLSRKAVLNENGDAVLAVRDALADACGYIESDRSKAASELEDYFKFETGFLKNSSAWQGTTFAYSTDPTDMIEAMRQDFEIAKIAGVAQVSSFDEVQQVLSDLI